jgi:hypothetical protein
MKPPQEAMTLPRPSHSRLNWSTHSRSTFEPRRELPMFLVVIRAMASTGDRATGTRRPDTSQLSPFPLTVPLVRPVRV